jgi:beta-lactamase class D
MKVKTANYPWVFWIYIQWRPKWFAFWWKTRGANAWDCQIWKFHISIGMPWFIGYVEANQRDYGSAKHIHETNKCNAKRPFSILINRR